MTVDELGPYLKESWPAIKKRLLEGSYQPKAVRRVRIPKPNGKERRELGIPSVVDRFIQQAILQVLQRPWDRRFSDYSYGFRPGRRAHQAVAQAQSFLRQGYEWTLIWRSSSIESTTLSRERREMW